jgi:hypothetical protein
MEAIMLQTIMDNELGNYFVINSGKIIEGTCSYDNKLYKPILKLLQLHFPNDENGFCEIESFLDDFETIDKYNDDTPEKLYDRLTKLKTPN